MCTGFCPFCHLLCFFHACSKPIELCSRADKSVFDLSRFRTKRKCKKLSILEILYADDVCVMADSTEHLQDYINSLNASCCRRKLTFSLNNKRAACAFLPSSLTARARFEIRLRAPERSIDAYEYQAPITDQLQKGVVAGSGERPPGQPKNLSLPRPSLPASLNRSNQTHHNHKLRRLPPP
ncbi:hypothetical protein ACJJTC_001569 [Scirpophaga incertulas]